jgi:hypothetical protein
MAKIAAVMISVENMRPSLIEHLARKAAPTGTNKDRGSLIVCDLRARSVPTFPRSKIWLAGIVAGQSGLAECSPRLLGPQGGSSLTAGGSLIAPPIAVLRPRAPPGFGASFLLSQEPLTIFLRVADINRPFGLVDVHGKSTKSRKAPVDKAGQDCAC